MALLLRTIAATLAMNEAPPALQTPKPKTGGLSVEMSIYTKSSWGVWAGQAGVFMLGCRVYQVSLLDGAPSLCISCANPPHPTPTPHTQS